MDDVEHGIYMDENNRRMVTNLRLQMSNLAESLLNEKEPKKALSVLDEMMRATPRQNVPFSRVMMPVAETYLQLAGDANVAPKAAALTDEDRTHAWAMAQEVVDQFMSMQEDQIVYCTSLDPEFYVALDREVQFALQIGDRLVRVMKYYHGTEEAKALEARLTEMESMVEAYEANYVALERIELKSMAAQSRRKDRIAILASGAGSNAEAILHILKVRPPLRWRRWCGCAPIEKRLASVNWRRRLGWKKATCPKLRWRTGPCLRISNRGKWIGLCSLGSC